jgi:hypothetical protein
MNRCVQLAPVSQDFPAIVSAAAAVFFRDKVVSTVAAHLYEACSAAAKAVLRDLEIGSVWLSLHQRCTKCIDMCTPMNMSVRESSCTCTSHKTICCLVKFQKHVFCVLCRGVYEGLERTRHAWEHANANANAI